MVQATMDLDKFQADAIGSIWAVKNKEELDEVEVKILGRKQGEFTMLMRDLQNLTGEERKVRGQKLNAAKDAIFKTLNEKREQLLSAGWDKIKETEAIDLTEPALPKKEFGHFHPITLVQNDLENLFTSMGFMVLSGPELESDYYNFTALNIPETHPARDMQDTFYIKEHPGQLMRTHTSPMQVRSMQKYGTPLRAIVPGKCFRNEATDVRHEHTLYQMEGFVVDKGINFSHLKGVLEIVAKHLYGEKTEVRLRPKFYPFVEPGVNGEVTCFICKGKGCRVCKDSGWLEVFGAGMIHPNVLKEGNVDTKEYSGFAFGFGLMRLVMLKYGIDDVRLFESGDLRFLEQF